MARQVCHIVDDDIDVAESTAFLLRTEGFETTTHSSGEAFLARFAELPHGLLLLDIRMPGINGLDLQRHLRDIGSEMPVIVVTGHGDVDMAVQAMKNGASDFLQKPFSREDLLAAVAAAGRVVRRPASAAGEAAEARARLAQLTARERQVLRGLLKGQANKMIAYDLGLSPRTIELYRGNSMRKLGVRSLPEMLHLAFLAGFGEDGEDQAVGEGPLVPVN
jgi:two-component system response regulator FixJ